MSLPRITPYGKSQKRLTKQQYCDLLSTLLLKAPVEKLHPFFQTNPSAEKIVSFAKRLGLFSLKKKGA